MSMQRTVTRIGHPHQPTGCPKVTEGDRSKTATGTPKIVEIMRQIIDGCPKVTDIPSWHSSLIGNRGTQLYAHEAINNECPKIGHRLHEASRP